MTKPALDLRCYFVTGSGSERDIVTRARDAARHLYERLTFWGLQPRMTVVEIEPGRGGGMSRAGLEALMARFPDAPAGGD